MKRAEYRKEPRGYGRILVLLLCAGFIYWGLTRWQAGKETQESQPATSQPAAEEQSREEGKQPTKRNEGAQEKIYRLADGQIETSRGSYALSQTAELWADGKKSGEAIGNYLTGQEAELEKNAAGEVTKISVQGSLEKPDKIRVLLSNGAGGYNHASLTVSCDSDFWTLRAGQIQTYPAGSSVTLGEEEETVRTCFYAASEKGKFTLTAGEAGTHTYYGSLEAAPGSEGYTVINEVDLETYLCGVVPSEMPESYGVEAAKAQAVCARSYACSQWKSSTKFAVYGAHLDNTVSSQCYNGAAEPGAASEGVKATWGQVLTFQDAIIPANYFSTSCGWTAAAADVWSGTDSLTYLSAKAQYTEGSYGDLSREEEFHAFITDTDVEAYDQESRWFRWSAVITPEQIQSGLEAYLSTAASVKVLQDEYFTEEACQSIGTVEDLYVYTRAGSGLATSLLITGSEAAVKIEGPQVIRQVLAAARITLSDGEFIGTRSLLPSAFICFEKTKDTSGELVSVKICGGGYGHGTGLSQTGVRGMVEQGYSYEEILAHYYEGTTLTDER